MDAAIPERVADGAHLLEEGEEGGDLGLRDAWKEESPVLLSFQEGGEGESARDPVELRDDGVRDRTVRGIQEGLHALDIALRHRRFPDGPEVLPIRLQSGNIPLDLPEA